MTQDVHKITAVEAATRYTPGHLIAPFGWAADALGAMVEAEPTLLFHLFELDRARMQLIALALLHESVLLRLLPEKAERDETGWSELLAKRFLERLPNQQESMADKIAVFVEDVLSASHSEEGRVSARDRLLDATRLREQNFVALVQRGTKERTRERIFAGFNTPLLPEVLICTEVGAEGIDLHRHCCRVIHYDLAWNPAVLEQRTGRVDRIGSKTFRERDTFRVHNGSIDGKGPWLEVGVPFLAGTYDERMFKELRRRAQTFEVLTGGHYSR